MRSRDKHIYIYGWCVLQESLRPLPPDEKSSALVTMRGRRLFEPDETDCAVSDEATDACAGKTSITSNSIRLLGWVDRRNHQEEEKAPRSGYWRPWTTLPHLCNGHDVACVRTGRHRQINTYARISSPSKCPFPFKSRASKASRTRASSPSFSRVKLIAREM